MRVTPLASGSQGNAVLVEFGRRRLLIDAGLDREELDTRLERVGVAPRSIEALLLTHRHRDHIRGATDFCRRHKVRVFAVRRTARALGTECHSRITRIVPERWFEPTDGVRVLPVPVAHDAPDTVAFLVESGARRYGHATDLGTANGPVRELLTECDVLYLEFNHDVTMLGAGGYPPLLKQRIASDRGHLSNDQAAELLRALAGPKLRHVFVAHVSQENNTAARAVDAARRSLDPWPEVGVELALQDDPTRAFAAVTG